MRIPIAIPLTAVVGLALACGAEDHNPPVSEPSASLPPKSGTPAGTKDLDSHDLPAAYIAAYVDLLNGGNREAAIRLWLDGGPVPPAGTVLSFKQTGDTHPADRSGMGMGIAAYRYIVAVHGRYKEKRPNGQPTSSLVDFLLVRASRQQPWRILGAVQDVRVAVWSHCGVRSVSVNGRLWLADPALGNHNPPPGWDENQARGYFVVTSPGYGEFYGDGGQRASFRLAPLGTDDPNAGCE